VGRRIHTCRPYRAEHLDGFQAINISRLWRFRPQIASTLDTHAICVAESIATDAEFNSHMNQSAESAIQPGALLVDPGAEVNRAFSAQLSLFFRILGRCPRFATRNPSCSGVERDYRAFGAKRIDADPVRGRAVQAAKSVETCTVADASNIGTVIPVMGQHRRCDIFIARRKRKSHAPVGAARCGAAHTYMSPLQG
jgi:hypothetical protein